MAAAAALMVGGAARPCWASTPAPPIRLARRPADRVLGFGLGLVVPVMTSSLLGSVDAERSGVASGTLNTARQTGSVIGVALFGSLGASGVVGGLHSSIFISVALALAVVCLAPFLRTF